MPTVLYEDADLVAVAKPAGVVVIPPRAPAGEESLRQQLERERGAPLWVVHRLDRETSGVVVFARSAAAHRDLCAAFEHRQVEKLYRGFVHGAPRSQVIDAPLHEARKGKMRPAAPGEPGALRARTEICLVRRFTRDGLACAEIEARPATGRQHQIRVHLRSVGAPLLFDAVYGLAVPAIPGAPCARLALHAERLLLPGRPEIVAPLPEDLVALAAWLAQPSPPPALPEGEGRRSEGAR